MYQVDGAGIEPLPKALLAVRFTSYLGGIIYTWNKNIPTQNLPDGRRWQLLVNPIYHLIILRTIINYGADRLTDFFPNNSSNWI